METTARSEKHSQSQLLKDTGTSSFCTLSQCLNKQSSKNCERFSNFTSISENEAFLSYITVNMRNFKAKAFCDKRTEKIVRISKLLLLLEFEFSDPPEFRKANWRGGKMCS